LNATSFAYVREGQPSSVWKEIVSECGYNSALMVDNGISLIPPSDFYEISSIDGITIELITNAALLSRDWVVIEASEMSMSQFSNLVTWINRTQMINSTIIECKPMRRVVRGFFKPVESPYIYAGPDGIFELGLILGLSLMGGLTAMIAAYMSYTAYRRSQKEKRKKRVLQEMECQKNIDGF